MIRVILSFLPMAVCTFWTVAIALNLREKGNRAAHRELMAWGVIATLLYSGHFVFFNRMESVIPFSDTIYVICNLLVYPLYLYYITVLTKGAVGSRQRWLTVLPPIIAGIIVAIVYLMMNDEDCSQYISIYLYKNSMQGLSGLAMVQAVIHQVAKCLFAVGVLTVLFVGIRHIRQYNKLIDSIYADNDGKRLYGITTILLLMLLTGVLSFTVNVVGRFSFLHSEMSFAAIACFFSSLLFLLFYRGFVQQFSFTDIAQEETEECKESKGNEDTSDVVPLEGYSRLLQRIDDERLYLQPGLTLAALAKQLGTNRTTLSKLVNEEAGMSFTDFINRKRIAFVIKLEQENPKARKQDLAEHVGYTSMRSFYRNYNLFKD